MLSALRWDWFEAPLVLKGPMDSIIFPGSVERMPVSILHPGNVMAMDNLSSHQTHGL